MNDLISRQAVIDAPEAQERQRATQKRRYTFGNNEFSLEAAYHDCKLVFDGITDDDSFQEADTGLILYYANEIIYALREIKTLPSAQSDIIRCNACKHWTQTTGNMPGFGLGDCDYLNAKLVNCNGYCYWAERREE
jgi:hypothetical protein